ncbi:hypothetical protein IZ6_20910 [Terrihabitans soli]|uniref:Uncharacterized protein n=1 Tax=Terrihabitans soli TaxID=708113 RepID=A0A6S6QPF8_9HYPH|nr:hypothetical protein IZ6_20910 [Terrihabitans soli]
MARRSLIGLSGERADASRAKAVTEDPGWRTDGQGYPLIAAKVATQCTDGEITLQISSVRERRGRERNDIYKIQYWEMVKGDQVPSALNHAPRAEQLRLIGKAWTAAANSRLLRISDYLTGRLSRVAFTRVPLLAGASFTGFLVSP